MVKREAMYYEKTDGNKLVCRLCPHNCKLGDGQSGLCRVRKNQNGKLMVLNYGEISSLALDHIEKKPLSHFYPGTLILSAGSYGCNLSCSFCQNHTIVHGMSDSRYLEAQELVDLALETRESGSIGVAFTYNEPSIWYEYIMDVAPLLQEKGLKLVLVSNGYLQKEPLEKLVPFIDAINVDVKAFRESFYQKFCQGSLKYVMETVERLVGKTHLEISTLLIPGENDMIEDIKELSQWLARMDKNIVLHLSRYYPAYKLNLPPTSVDTILVAQETAREYLPFVYTGNVLNIENNTYCPDCGNLLIKRNNYDTDICGIKWERCSNCKRILDFIKLY